MTVSAISTMKPGTISTTVFLLRNYPLDSSSFTIHVTDGVIVFRTIPMSGSILPRPPQSPTMTVKRKMIQTMMMTIAWLLSSTMTREKATLVQIIQRWLGITATQRKILTTSRSRRQALMYQCPRTPVMTRRKKVQKMKNLSGPPYLVVLDVNNGRPMGREALLLGPRTIRIIGALGQVTAIKIHVRETGDEEIQMGWPVLLPIMPSLLKMILIQMMMMMSRFHPRGGPEP